MSEIPKPTIGRIVLWRGNPQENYGGTREQPAMVTEVKDNGVVNLTVMANGTLPFPKVNVPYGEEQGIPGWRWPPRD